MIDSLSSAMLMVNVWDLLLLHGCYHTYFVWSPLAV